jgi:EAL domain-containing protein (putative c-di-GMP-specific phosphodiesterase class I)
MRNADQALYMAKEAGRGRARLFEPVYAEIVEQKLDLRRHLRYAVETGALHAHYQPQVDLRTGRVVGFEALLRWSHPERGPISPVEFIPIAESSGLIVDLGRWVLEEACRQGRAWLDAGLPPRTMSVNVSPAQLWNQDFATVVAAVLAETGFPAELLCLELTESLFVDHTEQQISRTLTALSGLGVRLALDDFGSGYSSLGYLTRLPFDRLKVDRAFVDGISTAPEKRKLLGGIIALSRGLGMTVVAEGAELAAEVDVLGALDCDLVQGFVFSRPVVPDDVPLVAASIERDARPAQPVLRQVI